jgi:hypothetical protein
MLNCLDVSLVISVLLSWRQTLLVYAFWSADRSRLLLHQPPGFHVQTDLTIARDRVIGVLLGILAIGFICDRFGARSDAEQTRKLFTHTLPMLARLGFSSIQRDTDKAFPEMQRLRSLINDSFTSLASQMDTAQFEIGFGLSD